MSAPPRKRLTETESGAPKKKAAVLPWEHFMIFVADEKFESRGIHVTAKQLSEREIRALMKTRSKPGSYAIRWHRLTEENAVLFALGQKLGILPQTADGCHRRTIGQDSNGVVCNGRVVALTTLYIPVEDDE